MVFRSKSQLVKALKRYGLVTKRSIEFKKSESDRVRAKCGFPNCPWLIYGAKFKTQELTGFRSLLSTMSTTVLTTEITS